MTRPPSYALALTAALSPACDDTDEIAPSQLNFNRPIDVAFACYGGLRITNGGAADVRPGPSCRQASRSRRATFARELVRRRPLPPVPPGQEDLTAMMGVPAARGAVVRVRLAVGAGHGRHRELADQAGAVVHRSATSRCSMPDPLTPGQERHRDRRDAGRHRRPTRSVVTTRRRTPARAICRRSTSRRRFNSTPALTLSNSCRSPTRAARHSMRAKPNAIVATPATGTIGVAVPGDADRPRLRRVSALPPGRGVDLSTGIVQPASQYDSRGVPSILPDVSTSSCPDECRRRPDDRRHPAVVARSPARSEQQRRVLAIGADELERGDAWSSSTSTRIPQSTRGSRTPEPDRHARRQRASRSRRRSAWAATRVSQRHDVARPARCSSSTRSRTTHRPRRRTSNSLRKECDTQVDPRYLHDNKNIKRLSCIPVIPGPGDPATPPRRAGARAGHPAGQPHAGDPTSTSSTNVDTNDDDALRGTANVTVPMGIDIFEIRRSRRYCRRRRWSATSRVITSARRSTRTSSTSTMTLRGLQNREADNAVGTPMSRRHRHQLRDCDLQRDLVAERSGCQQRAPTRSRPDLRHRRTRSRCAERQHQRRTAQPVARSPRPCRRCRPPSSRARRSTSCRASTRCVASAQMSRLRRGADRHAGLRDAVLRRRARARPIRSRCATPSTPTSWAWTQRRDVDADLRGLVSGDTLDTAVNGPPIRDEQMFVDRRDRDVSSSIRRGPFCDAGVEPYDIVQLRGCDPTLGNAECPLGYTCFVHPDSQVTGPRRVHAERPRPIGSPMRARNS